LSDVFQGLFKYPWDEFARGKIILAGAWPGVALWWTFAAGALLIVAVAARRHRYIGAVRLGLVCVLQIAMLGLALLAVWQPALFLQSLRRGENTVAIMLDTSQSMALIDGATTRTAQALAALAAPALSQLQQSYPLRRFAFSSTAEAVESFDPRASLGSQTAIGDSVAQVLRQLRTAPLGAVILVSDGDDSAGSISPEQLAEIASYGVPVHTIGIGREQMPEDLELHEVLLPERALPGTTLSARVAVRHDGPGTARLKVYDGERFVAGRDIALPADSQLTSAPISLELPDSGYRELRFTLEAKPGEVELRNNTRTRIVDVSDRRASILYVEGEPRWDYKFLRRALDKDRSVRLASLLRVSTNGYYRQGVAGPEELKGGFPTDKRSLYAYDALIIGSMPAAWFKPAQQQLIRDFVSERGGSLLMLAGPNGLGDGGWGDSIVGRILPAQLPSRGGSFHRVSAAVVPTARGRRTPMLQLSDNATENDKLWRELPPLADYQDLGELRLASVSLLDVKLGPREQPLLVSQPYGRGRTLILATGGTWRWRMGLPVEDRRHEQFWRQLMRGLVTDVPQPFELTAHVRAGKIAIRASVRDEAFEPQSQLQVSAHASSSNGAVDLTLRPNPTEPGVYEAAFEPKQSGSFIVEASAQQSGQPVRSARTLVRYEQGEAEYFSLRQNRSLLEQLAAATGGRYWRPGQLAGLPAAIRASAAGVPQQEVLPLWDAPALFLLLAALKSGEWLLRRRWGAV
jgi:uncharacterized membrane protein